MAVASIALLFVAAGLLLLATIAIGRRRGRATSRRDMAMVAAMTGVAIGFLMLVVPVVPLVLLPLVIGGVLAATWHADGRWLELGAFLLALGLLWCVAETQSLVNDLGDPAVTRPAWTPVPFALAGIVSVVGGALLLSATRSGASR